MVGKDVFFDHTQVVRFDAAVLGKANGGGQPEFAFAIRGSDMNVRRFVAFIGVKMEPVGSNPQDGWHV